MQYHGVTKELDHKSLGKVKITLEYPQVESLEEAAKFAKSPENLLRLVNGVFKQRAIAGPTQQIRKDESPNSAAFEEKIPQFQALSRNYTPEDSSGVSNKDVVELFNEVKANPEKYSSMSVADLLAELQARKG